MPALVLGPLLRYVGETDAVVWVETDVPCTVEVLGERERTFHVAGHHHALVRAQGLEPGRAYTYEVLLDGERAWPQPGSPLPPSRFRTFPQQGPLRICFGSCRAAVPGRGVDALGALVQRMRAQDPEEWPDLLLLLGDQVYADDVSAATRGYLAARRDLRRRPGARVWGYEEYTRLYRESWGEPCLRWLLSTVSTAMIFDDHDVNDDWNLSASWVADRRAEDWWDEHITGALASYWVYQHLGNLSPDEHEREELFAEVRAARDAGPLLHDFAREADRRSASYRWSYRRDLGTTRLVTVDSRAGRVLDEGARSMLDEGEWAWLEREASGGYDHLLLATSLPWLVAPGVHHLEAWSEAVCAGAWGPRAARAVEHLRQALDLEHWAAFQESFVRLGELQRAVGAGERGDPPASVVTLSGDVHHAYLAEVTLPQGRGGPVRSSVWQAVCSPVRNPLPEPEQWVMRAARSRPATALARALARAASVRPPAVAWREVGGGPWFDNQLGTLVVDGRRLDLVLERAAGSEATPRLEPVLRRRLA